MKNSRTVLTLVTETRMKLELPIEDWSFEFHPEKWERVQINNNYNEWIPSSERKDGGFAVLRAPDGRSNQAFNLGTNGLEFREAVIKIDIYGDGATKNRIVASPTLIFNDVGITQFIKINGKDKLTFYFKSTNIPQIMWQRLAVDLFNRGGLENGIERLVKFFPSFFLSNNKNR